MTHSTSPVEHGAPASDAGMAYALLFGASFAAGAWVPDALGRAARNAHLPAASLAIGAPVLLAGCAAAGYLLRRARRPRRWVWVWVALGAFAGLLVSALPFWGRTIATWLAEPGLLPTITHAAPSGYWGQAAFLTALMAGVGSVVGLAGFAVVVKVSGARTRPVPRNAWGQWALLAVAVPMALLPALAAGNLFAWPAREVMQAADDALTDRLSEPYTLHLVRLDPGGRGAIIDVELDDGYMMRCSVAGSTLASCVTVSSRFRDWMRTITAEAATGAQPPDTPSETVGLSVASGALAPLAAVDGLSGDFEIVREAQHDDWVVMSARHDSGTIVTCHFRGTSPVVLDRCKVR